MFGFLSRRKAYDYAFVKLLLARRHDRKVIPKGLENEHLTATMLMVMKYFNRKLVK